MQKAARSEAASPAALIDTTRRLLRSMRPGDPAEPDALCGIFLAVPAPRHPCRNAGEQAGRPSAPALADRTAPRIFCARRFRAARARHWPSRASAAARDAPSQPRRRRRARRHSGGAGSPAVQYCAQARGDLALFWRRASQAGLPRPAAATSAAAGGLGARRCDAPDGGAKAARARTAAVGVVQARAAGRRPLPALHMPLLSPSSSPGPPPTSTMYFFRRAAHPRRYGAACARKGGPQGGAGAGAGAGAQGVARPAGAARRPVF